MLRRSLLPLALLAQLAVAAPAVGSPSTATQHIATPATTSQTAARPASMPTLGPAQSHYLTLAKAGIARAEATWHDKRRGWYDARLYDRDRYPLATIWDSVPLFESLTAVAIAQPTAANRRAVARFAAGAERYLNHGLRPLAGYSPYPDDRDADTETWFDDNGWWGLAFFNAYRATGTPRYLADATRALRFIAISGWDPSAGGIWWNTEHPYKAGEAIASATLLATLIYQQNHSAFALGQARKFLKWANTAGFSASDGLYAASDISSTPIDYIEAPLIYAQRSLCASTGETALCQRAESLKATALHRFGDLLDFAPQYDAIYLQWMLALYSSDHAPALYSLAAANAHEIETRARNAQGLYLNAWNGTTLPAQYARPGMLQTDAASVSVFAWLAVYPPPS
jgi:hypothetical protein